MSGEMALHRAQAIVKIDEQEDVPKPGTPSYEYGTPLSAEKPAEKKQDTSKGDGSKSNFLSDPSPTHVLLWPLG